MKPPQFRFARDRPSRYGAREVRLPSQVCEGQALALRCAREICLPSQVCEGQALALRCEGTLLHLALQKRNLRDDEEQRIK